MLFPAPLLAMPVTFTVLVLVQVYAVPATVPLIAMVEMAVPEHEFCINGAASAFGAGLTRTVAVIAGPGQLLAVGVMVNVTVTGTFDVLLRNPEIELPAPLAAMPDTRPTLSLVHAKIGRAHV